MKTTRAVRISVAGVLAVLGVLLSVPAQAATPLFAPIPPLFFTKAFGGANPLPQTVSVASSSTAFNFGVVVSTATGGSWLSVPDDGCCYTTPNTITVVVNASQTLAAGNYSGQIVLTAQTGGTSITVPVTLTVAPPGGAFFDNAAGQMSFSLKTGGTAITSQQIQVRNGGTGTLNWTLAASTSDTAQWLTVSANSGTAPSLVTVGITVANLPGGGVVAGTYVGQLLFQTASSGNFTVPVSVVVGANIITQVNPIGFTKVFAGANPLAQTLTIASTGTAFNVGISVYNGTGGAWLSVPDSGCCYTLPNTITAVVNPSVMLAAGTYTSEIVVTAQTGAMSITVTVTLTVAPAGSTYFDNVGGQMSFALKTQSTTITTQDIQIRNGGTGTLNWTLTASTGDAGPWLNVSATTGTAPSQITVGVSVANLPNAGLIAGTFVGQLLFQTGDGASITVPVSVVVGDDILTQVNAISFTKVFGGADPLPQTLTMASTGKAFNVGVAVYNATGGSWLSVPDDGCCYTLPNTITAVVKASPTLPVGTYTSEIVVTAQDGSMSVTIPVTLTVSPATSPFIDNLPGQMSFSVETGSTTSPPAQTLQIRNGGTGPLAWTLSKSTSDGGNWLNASAVTGTAPSLVSVSIVKQNLPGLGLIAGTFVGNLVFQTAGDSFTVPVSVVVGDNIITQVNAINFTKVYGGADPLPQTLTITSTGTNFNVAVAVSTATGGSWLSVPDDGCCYTLPNTLTAVVKTSPTLAVGTYTSQIVVTAQSGSMSITVPVTLTVSPASLPFFDNVPGQMSFSFGVSTGNPPTQDVQIRNGGGGALNFTLAPTTSDGGNWLTVSTPNGTAPSNVTVGVVANALPGQGLIAGTFSGELVFLSDLSAITIPVSVVVGPNAFVQLSALTFTKQFGGANPLSQTLQIASGGTNFNFALAAASANGGSWLSVSPGTGCCYTTPRSITVSVNASATLGAGTYTGQVVVTAQSGAMAMTVPVIFTVTSTAPSIPATNAVIPVWGGSTSFGSNMYVTIYGSNLSTVTQDWSQSFTGATAPTTLGGVSVTVNNIPAFIQYVSPTQINIDTPDDTATGTVNIVVTNGAGASNTGTATRTRISPTLLSAPQFKNYVVAERPDFSTYIGPLNLIPGIAFAAAKPGDTVVIFATGCGPTSPATQAGMLAAQNSPLALPFQMKIGGVQANVPFGGMLAGTVGLYQFNVVIPAVPPGDQTIELTVDGIPSAQNLVITIGQ